jgi:signal peptidase II
MTTKNKKAWPWLWLSLAVIIVDQFSKYIAVRTLTFGVPKKILPFFNLNLNFNTGAAFSFLGTQSGWQVYFFAMISFVVVLFLLVCLARIKRTDICMAAGMCLVIGGALGNLIDRLRFKFVVDFFDFHVNHWHFATFNVADSAVCIGAFLIMLRLLLK